MVEVEEVYTGQMWTFHAVDLHINIGPLHPYYVYECRVSAYTVEQGPFTAYIEVYSGERGMQIDFPFFIPIMLSLLCTSCCSPKCCSRKHHYS